jgi:hypothetical protein
MNAQSSCIFVFKSSYHVNQTTHEKLINFLKIKTISFFLCNTHPNLNKFIIFGLNGSRLSINSGIAVRIV